MSKLVKVSKYYKFLLKNGSKTIALGDTFDFKRNDVSEDENEYLEKTSLYHKLIGYFVGGNHDFYFVKRNRKRLNSVLNLVNVKKNVLFFHGHQLFTGFYTPKEWRYLKYYNTGPRFNPFSKLEWFLCKNFAEFFIPPESKAKDIAINVLTKCEKAGILSDRISVVVTGHTHLPYDVNVTYKGKGYRVANCGSAVMGSEFKPVYVNDIDRWFVSDLHLGTEKTLCN